ncbi:MAG: alpha/beta fold hydrolase [Tahibacter sp.]
MPELSAHVILLHGIWMRGFSLMLLRRRLAAAGFSTELFNYASLYSGPQRSCARLIQRMRRSGAQRVHLVGHSLGGLIALEAVRGRTDLPVGHVVCLGSPLNGSDTARALARRGGARYLLGQSRGLLCEGLSPWDGSRPVGVIAGDRALGFGGLIATLSTPHDGTVSVHETLLAGLADHHVLSVTHTGMVWSRPVASMVCNFLHNATF